MSSPNKVTSSKRDIDPKTLFETHSVDEVRAVERKIRSEIEWKKEEMRDLVGERYRDLISAANTIKQMKECAIKVNDSLTSMHTQCQKLKEGRLTTNITIASTNKKSSDRHLLFEVACEIKFLIAVPGRLWKYLDTNDYLPAAELYLLAKHVHDCLQLDRGTGGKVTSQFPVITRQWTAISHFKSSILQGCKQVLSDFTESDSGLVKSISALLILEEKTPRQVFQDFLVARMFNTRGSVGVRKLISSAVQLVHNTVYQISGIFSCTDETTANLSSTLAAISQTPTLDRLAIDEFTSLKPHLPKIITGFKPSLRVQNVSFTQEYLYSSCDQWINSCLDSIRNTVKDQLSYVNSISALLSVRDTVFHILLQDRRLSDWSDVCETVISAHVNIWSDVLQVLFTNRIQELIYDRYTHILQTSSASIDNVKISFTTGKDRSDPILSYESDNRKYIWSESAADVPSSEHWLPSSIKQFKHGGCLLMKAYGFTPLVQRLCHDYNEKLSVLINDIESYRILNLSNNQSDSRNKSNNQPDNRMNRSFLGDLELSSQHLAEFSSKQAYQSLCGLHDKLREELEIIKSSLSEDSLETTSSQQQTLRWLLVIARLCSALPHLSTDLEKAVTLGSTSSSMNKSTSLMARSLSKSYTKPVDPLWSECVELLSAVSLDCYRLWSETIEDMITSQFSTSFNSTDPGSVLSHITRWDEIEIEEDSETGDKIKSTISVPMQVTWCLQQTLNLLCNRINMTSGHAVNRCVITDMACSVLLRILRVYDSKICEQSEIDGWNKDNQRICLQYLFDVWYLTGLISHRDTKEEARVEKLASSLVEKLQSKVDPFDLDVFTPYMQKHVSQQRARHMTLFGAIADTEKIASTSRQQLTTGHSEQHNVMPLFTGRLTRFSLLPVSSENDKLRFNLPQQMLNKHDTIDGKKKDSYKPTPTAASAPVLKPSSSFYDRIGAMSWFTGNKN